MTAASAADNLLTAAQSAALRQRSDAWGVALVAHAWGVVAASVALVAWWPNAVSYALAIVLIGSRQLGLLILMHDGAHGMLCRTPRLNRILSQWLCAFPVFADTDVYRRYHLQHHARTMQEDDPDLILTGHYPIPRASLRRKLWRDLTGRTGYAQRRAQLAAALGPAGAPVRGRLAHFSKALGCQCVANAVLFGALAVAGHWHFYFTLWLLPLLTWHQAVLRVRNIAEHAVVPDRDDPFGNARTTHANWLERALVAPYWVNFHLEHHLVMWIPCFRLPQLQACLHENGHTARMKFTDGYRNVLREATVIGADAAAADLRRAQRSRAVGTFSGGYTEHRADDSRLT